MRLLGKRKSTHSFDIFNRSNARAVHIDIFRTVFTIQWRNFGCSGWIHTQWFLCVFSMWKEQLNELFRWKSNGRTDDVSGPVNRMQWKCLAIRKRLHFCETFFLLSQNHSSFIIFNHTHTHIPGLESARVAIISAHSINKKIKFDPISHLIASFVTYNRFIITNYWTIATSFRWNARNKTGKCIFTPPFKRETEWINTECTSFRANNLLSGCLKIHRWLKGLYLRSVK